MSRQRIAWILYCLWISAIIQDCYGQNVTVTAQDQKNLALTEGDSATLTCSFTVANDVDRGTVLFAWLRQQQPGNYGRDAGARAAGIRNENRTEYRISSLVTVLEDKTKTVKRNDTEFTIERMPDTDMGSIMIENINVNYENSYFCYIYTSSTAPPEDDWDDFYLTVSIPPTVADMQLQFGKEDNWVQANISTTLTCTVPRVKPNVTRMEIALHGQTLNGAITETSNGDKTYSNTYTVTTIVNRTDKGKIKVECKALWNGDTYTKERSIRVVWKVEDPKLLSVNPGAKSCQVDWEEDKNVKTVYVCYTKTTGDCTDVGMEDGCDSVNNGSEWTIDYLQSGANYCVWLYATNELGRSKQNSKMMECTPTFTTTTIAATATPNQDGTNIGLIAGMAVLVVVIAIGAVIVVICVLKSRTKVLGEDNEAYAEVDKSQKAPAREVPTMPNADESPYADGPEVPSKAPELVRELNGDSPYDVVHWESQQPQKSDYASVNVGKKAQKEKKESKEKKPKAAANENAAPDHVTQPSSRHVTPPPLEQKQQPEAKQDTQTPAPAKQEKKAKKDKKKPPKGDENKLYAEVAIPQQKGHARPIPKVKDTEYQAVQFRRGPRMEDNDSD